MKLPPAVSGAHSISLQVGRTTYYTQKLSTTRQKYLVEPPLSVVRLPIWPVLN